MNNQRDRKRLTKNVTLQQREAHAQAYVLKRKGSIAYCIVRGNNSFLEIARRSYQISF